MYKHYGLVHQTDVGWRSRTFKLLLLLFDIRLHNAIQPPSYTINSVCIYNLFADITTRSSDFVEYKWHIYNLKVVVWISAVKHLSNVNLFT
jgi:hypothetical protein